MTTAGSFVPAAQASQPKVRIDGKPTATRTGLIEAVKALERRAGCVLVAVLYGPGGFIDRRLVVHSPPGTRRRPALITHNPERCDRDDGGRGHKNDGFGSAVPWERRPIHLTPQFGMDCLAHAVSGFPKDGNSQHICDRGQQMGKRRTRPAVASPRYSQLMAVR